MWSLDLTYCSYTDKWTTSADAHITNYGEGRAVSYLDAAFAPDFRYYDSAWKPWGLFAETASRWSLSGNLNGLMTLTHARDSGRTAYRFNGPMSGTNPGKLTLYAEGDPDDNLSKLTYTYNDGVPDYVEDGHGRQIHFQFDTAGKLVKIIEPNPAAANPTTNMYGRVTYLVWDVNKVTSMKIGMPNTLQPGYGEDWDEVTWSDYTTRSTGFTYENGKLAYVILPDKYDAWQEDEENPEDYAAQAFTYYTSGENAGKLQTQSSCSSCGGGGTIKYQYAVDPINNILLSP